MVRDLLNGINTLELMEVSFMVLNVAVFVNTLCVCKKNACFLFIDHRV